MYSREPDKGEFAIELLALSKAESDKLFGMGWPLPRRAVTPLEAAKMIRELVI
jgi:hypothetical protein